MSQELDEIKQGSSLDRALYHDDMNAARELEEEIERRGLIKEYITAIDALVTYPPDPGWQGYRWGILRATPEQRAQAFLAVLVGA